MYVHLTLASRNKKTGHIPVSTTSADSCPPSCPFRDNGCYAKYGPLRMHWNKVSTGERALAWADFLAAIKKFPAGQLWRHNQAGDLPGLGDAIDGRKLRELVKANTNRRGFTYTHKPMTPANYAYVQAANDEGFAVNVSTNNLAHADEVRAAYPRLPVVTVVPDGGPEKGQTPAGNDFIVCPAQTRDDVTCATCRLCAHIDARRPIIAFRAHGTGKKHIEATLL